MIIGSRYSMSYLKPSTTIYRLLRFFYRWQSNNIEEQYKRGIRLFDIHVYINAFGKMCFKSGNIIYDCFSFYEPFSFLNKMGDCYVNLVLEETKVDSRSKDIGKVEDKFLWLCEAIQVMYPDIKFMGGYREYDNKVLYDFNDELKVFDYLLMDFV